LPSPSPNIIAFPYTTNLVKPLCFAKFFISSPMPVSTPESQQSESFPTTVVEVASGV
jgi:hypothetical protein